MTSGRAREREPGGHRDRGHPAQQRGVIGVVAGPVDRDRVGTRKLAIRAAGAPGDRARIPRGIMHRGDGLRARVSRLGAAPGARASPIGGSYQPRGFTSETSFKLGVFICEPVHAHCITTPQRGHSNCAASRDALETDAQQVAASQASVRPALAPLPDTTRLGAGYGIRLH